MAHCFGCGVTGYILADDRCELCFNSIIVGHCQICHTPMLVQRYNLHPRKPCRECSSEIMRKERHKLNQIIGLETVTEIDYEQEKWENAMQEVGKIKNKYQMSGERPPTYPTQVEPRGRSFLQRSGAMDKYQQDLEAEATQRKINELIDGNPDDLIASLDQTLEDYHKYNNITSSQQDKSVNQGESES